MADLELALIEQVADAPVTSHERQALVDLQAQLRRWRKSGVLRFHSHAIIVVERTVQRRDRRLSRNSE